jgi:hypothetical protein
MHWYNKTQNPFAMQMRSVKRSVQSRRRPAVRSNCVALFIELEQFVESPSLGVVAATLVSQELVPAISVDLIFGLIHI